jgi:hypothetical protein
LSRDQLNAGNYYPCYRQIDGSSVLRIAKVVNGVETVLKSASVTNPTQGSRFTLSCQATGGSLTLRLDGVIKATVVGGLPPPGRRAALDSSRRPCRLLAARVQ